MKTNVLIFGLFLALGLWSCGESASDNSSQKETPTQTEQQAEEKGPEYTSAYICPMHCEGSGSDEPGQCPVCGMDYVKNEEMN